MHSNKSDIFERILGNSADNFERMGDVLFILINIDEKHLMKIFSSLFL